MTFEQAFERLEKIVRELEDGDGTLSESLEKYENGIGLLKHCWELLENAEAKIEILLESEGGELIREPFTHDKEEDNE